MRHSHSSVLTHAGISAAIIAGSLPVAYLLPDGAALLAIYSGLVTVHVAAFIVISLRYAFAMRKPLLVPHMAYIVKQSLFYALVAFLIGGWNVPPWMFDWFGLMLIGAMLHLSINGLRLPMYRLIRYPGATDSEE